MINDDGVIDMKRLAEAVGISRATIYRHYSDRRQVEGAVAGRALEQMLPLVLSGGGDHIGRCQIAASFLIDHPAEATAIVSMVEQVGVDVLATTADHLVGDGAYAPWLIGIAAMSRTAWLSGDSAHMHAIVEGLADRR